LIGEIKHAKTEEENDHESKEEFKECSIEWVYHWEHYTTFGNARCGITALCITVSRV
jgi:hypothetical protein